MAERTNLKQLTIFAVLIVALGGWWVYRIATREDYNIKPVTHSPGDYIVTWRCFKCDHEWQDRVARGPHKCPKCGAEEGYVHLTQACGKCGAFVVAYQYDEDLNPIEFKYKDGPWQPFTNEMGEWQLVCPTCGGPAMPAEAPRLADPEPTPSPGG